MHRGLLAPLSPHEEAALRRMAHGLDGVEARHADRLRKLGLITSDGQSPCLTALGRLRCLTLAEPPPLFADISRPRPIKSDARSDPPRPAVVPVYFSEREYLEKARRNLLELRRQRAALHEERVRAVAVSRLRIESSLALLQRTPRHDPW